MISLAEARAAVDEHGDPDVVAGRHPAAAGVRGDLRAVGGLLPEDRALGDELAGDRRGPR